MSECPVCAHKKIGAIDAGLAIGLTPSVIAGKYHVAKKLVELHAEHRSSRTPVRQALAETSTDEATMASCELCAARPSLRFQQAWQDAKDDRQEQHRMVMWLNEQLQSADASAEINDFS